MFASWLPSSSLLSFSPTRNLKFSNRNIFDSNFSSNENFKRKAPGRNNHNASKLIEKYSNLAREALSNGDKILSENYFQHADHFTRIQSEQDVLRKTKYTENTNSSSEAITNNEKKIDDTSANEVEK